MEATNAAVGSAAVTSPLWLPTLESVSEVAAMVVPILGAIWLFVQITTKLREVYKEK